MKQELKEILYKISDMHRYIFTAEMKETIINKTVDDITKLATPQINLDEVERLVCAYSEGEYIETIRIEACKNHYRKAIGYQLSDLSPSKPGNNG